MYNQYGLPIVGLEKDSGLYSCGIKSMTRRDNMSLMCIIARSGFIAMFSDSRAMSSQGEAILVQKIFQLADTNILIGCTGCITYGTRFFGDIVNEMALLHDKSISGIVTFIRETLPKYIKETNLNNCDHFAHIFIAGEENNSLYVHHFSFNNDGHKPEDNELDPIGEYLTGADEVPQILLRKIKSVKTTGMLDIQDNCISFIETEFDEIVKMYDTKPENERVIGGEVQYAVITLKD